MLLKKFLMTSALVGAALPVAAQETADVFMLDELVLTASLMPIASDALGRAATVVTGEELEERGITTVQDALRATPGVSLSTSGDSLTGLRIRGSESNHTLILIDGVEASAEDGTYPLSGLSTFDVERVEIIRGPQSAFYGSNAAAGVVNIITRAPEPGVHTGGMVEYGDGWNAGGYASVGTEKGGLRLGLSRHDDDGYDHSGKDGEKDGIDRRTLSLKGQYEVAPGLTFGGLLRRSDERYDNDSTSWTATTADDYVVDNDAPYVEREERLASVWGEWESFGGRVLHRLSYERTDFDQDSSGSGLAEAQQESFKYRLSYGLDGQPLASSNHLMNLLVEREDQESTTNPEYSPRTDSLALEYRGSFANGLDVQIGGRYDDNDSFANARTWNVGLSYEPQQDGIRLHASAGTGVVNPSYIELYGFFEDAAFLYRTIGNPDLKPERNRSFDIGVEVPLAAGRGVLDVTYFQETLEGEIDYISAVSEEDGFNVSSPINEDGDSERHGVEVSGRYEVNDDLRFRAAYTWLDANEPNGRPEVRRPKHEFGFGVSADLLNDRALVAADLRHVRGVVDSRFYGAGGTAELEDFTVVDLSGDYRVTETVTATARVENVFDEDYSETLGYATRGRAAYVGLRANW
ncbi:TonB-dependent receptor plug domain-containing protein [Paracoccaceae bacterium GXU_MW_L88]